MKTIYIYIIIFLFNSAIYGTSIKYGGKHTWKNCKIENGKITYIPGKGRAIEIMSTDEVIDDFTEMFLNFNNKSPSSLQDLTGNYKILYSNYYINPEQIFQDTRTAGFLKPEHKIKIKVNKNNLWATSVDLGSFTIDFWIYPTFFYDCKIFYKGIYYQGKFYGIKIKITKKRIVAQFLNMFYDSNNKVYSIIMDKSPKLKRNRWHHIAFTFERQTGKITQYIDGEEIEVKFATVTGKSDDAILTPHFLKIDGSDFVIGEDFFGYLDNFRISRIARKEFKLIKSKIKDKCCICSKVLDLNYYHSKIDKIRFEFRNITDTTSKIFIRNSNNLFHFNDKFPNWQVIYPLNKDIIEISDIKDTRYFQWKIEIFPLSSGISPALTSVEIKYTSNVPPNPPRKVKIKKLNENTVELEWVSSGEENIKGYIIYWGTTPKNYENKLDVGFCNRYIMELSKRKQHYFFAITAYNGKDPYNESAFSKEVSIYLK